DLLLRLGDGRAAAARAVAAQPEDLPVREEVADSRGARADAEADEADREHDREQDEHPLRLPAQAREEHLLLYGAVTAASACSLLASMRLRALAAALRSLCHGN